MGRILLVLGLFLLCGAVFLIIMITSSAEARANFDNIVNNTLCNPDETLEVIYGLETSFNTNSGNNEDSRDWFCVASDGTQRKVTGLLMLGMISTFALPFVGGLALIIAGISMNARRKARQYRDF